MLVGSLGTNRICGFTFTFIDVVSIVHDYYGTTLICCFNEYMVTSANFFYFLNVLIGRILDEMVSWWIITIFEDVMTELLYVSNKGS